MIVKALAALAVALALCLTGMGLLYRNAVQSAAAQKVQLEVATAGLQQAAKQRKSDVATLAARSAANASQWRKLVEASQALQMALQGVSVWSEADVPAEVQRALLRDSGGPKNAPD
jgi:hypothetical protein